MDDYRITVDIYTYSFRLYADLMKAQFGERHAFSASSMCSLYFLLAPASEETLSARCYNVLFTPFCASQRGVEGWSMCQFYSVKLLAS